MPSPAPESLELSDRFTDERRLQHQANDELDVEDHVAARRAAQACLVINPTNRECFRAELSSYTRTGDLATARLLLDECLLDEPDDLDCLGARVTQHLRQGELTSARSVVDRLHHLAPDSGISHFADGEIAHRSGDRATAAAAYERACTDGQEFACDRARVLRGKLDSGTD